MTKKERAALTVERLEKLYPDVKCSLNYTTPLEMLLATQMSAQCTDASVNKVTQTLFKKYTCAEDFANADIEQLQEVTHVEQPGPPERVGPRAHARHHAARRMVRGQPVQRRAREPARTRERGRAPARGGVGQRSRRRSLRAGAPAGDADPAGSRAAIRGSRRGTPAGGRKGAGPGPDRADP